MRTVFGKEVCESLNEVVAPHRCAVLVVDMQNDAVHPGGSLATAGLDVSAITRMASVCRSFIQVARAQRVPIVHARTVVADGGLSDSGAWLYFKRQLAGDTQFFLEGSWGAQFFNGFAPMDGEITITKRRSSAFYGTELASLLRSNGVETVIVVGEQTPGCVEATLRDAAHADFYPVLVEDCVAAIDSEQHEMSLAVQRKRHDVCGSKTLEEIWRSVGGPSLGNDRY